MNRTAKFHAGQTLDVTITEITGHAHTMQANQYCVMAVVVRVEVKQYGVRYMVDDGFSIHWISEGDVN
jgi:hypothetical protein